MTTCQHCGRRPILMRRLRLCRPCYNRLWARGELGRYAPPPLPPIAPPTGRLIPPAVRQQIRAAVEQGHSQAAVAAAYRISRHSVCNICHEEPA